MTAKSAAKAASARTRTLARAWAKLNLLGPSSAKENGISKDVRNELVELNCVRVWKESRKVMAEVRTIEHMPLEFRSFVSDFRPRRGSKLEKLVLRQNELEEQRVRIVAAKKWGRQDLSKEMAPYSHGIRSTILANLALSDLEKVVDVDFVDVTPESDDGREAEVMGPGKGQLLLTSGL